MKFNFDKSSLEFSKRGVVTGIVSLQIGDNIFFPEEDWNDTIVIIINSWLANMLLIKKKVNKDVRFYFMDGPFSFSLKKVDQTWEIETFEGLKTLNIYKIVFLEFTINLIKVAHELLIEVAERNWESGDLEELKLTLEKAVSSFGTECKTNVGKKNGSSTTK